MIGKIKSHPEIYLHQHINQIKMVIEQGILPWHSEKTITAKIKELLDKSAVFHDLGKANQAFQKYIVDTKQYRGSKQEKTHTLLSLIITLAVAQEEQWDEDDILILAAVIKGHHSRLPTIPQKQIGAINCPVWDIDNFVQTEKRKILKKQLAVLKFMDLEAETGIKLSNMKMLNSLLGEPRKTIGVLGKNLVEIIKTHFQSMSVTAAVDFRLKTQLVYSILLEADKAFLAISDTQAYLQKQPKQWQWQWIDQKIGTPENNATNKLRQKARQEIMQPLANYCPSSGGVFSLTAPTGVGKTLLAASWAFQMSEMMASKQAVKPKIIIVLPFLSIIEQTAKEYQKLLALGGYKPDGEWLLKSHSLADRKYYDGLEDEDKEKDGAFFIDTWRSEVIITTYDQFLMSLMNPKAKYQMRFHNLCDAVIIMDEVQSIPCKLWQPLAEIFTSLAKVGNSKILLMSATLPSFVNGDKPLLSNYQMYFKSFKRYKIVFELQKKQSIDDFCERLSGFLPEWLKKGRRILITMNTRRSAKFVRDALHKAWLQEHEEVPLIFISADVTPRDRLEAVKKIKKGGPCIVVSTQCIEAGVDIDMDEVYRDFAPLDNLIQIAGRCNREWKNNDRKRVTVVDIKNAQGKLYSNMIYDPTHLQVTREIVADKPAVMEEDILDLADQYFKRLSAEKDTGKQHLIRFAYWQDDVPVRELLRGEQYEQYSFLVLEQDIKLEKDMQAANDTEDKWQRREAWKKLAGRIALVSVKVYARASVSPGWFAREFLGQYWIVEEGVYSTDRGLQLEDDVDRQIL